MADQAQPQNPNPQGGQPQNPVNPQGEQVQQPAQGAPGEAQQQPQGQPQDPNPQGGQPQGQTQDGDAAQQSEEEAIQEFLNSTPPPEPRGSAYKSTPDFDEFSTTVKIPDHANTAFDEKYFLYLFSGSLSLSIVEKKNIIAKLPELSQFQVDELIKILEEEKQKFDQLEEKHPDQVQKLRSTAKQEWNMLEMEEQKQKDVVGEQQQVDDIKKSLGL